MHSVDFIGPAIWDTYVRAERIPEENSRVEVFPAGSGIGGPAVEAGLAYLACGGKGRLIPIAGTDEYAERMGSDVAGRGIPWQPIRVPGSSNASYVIVTPNGARTILVSRSASRNADPGRVISRLEGQRGLGTMVHLDSVSPKFSMAIAEFYREHGASVSLDLFGEPSDDTLHLAAMADIIGTEEGFAAHWPSLDGFIDEWLGNGARVVVVTLGERGSVVATVKDSLRLVQAIPAERVEGILDTTGAGDVFHGAFLYAYRHRGMSLELAARWASRAVVPVLQGYGAWHALDVLREWGDGGIRESVKNESRIENRKAGRDLYPGNRRKDEK